jgi:hypothetical protein
LPPVISVITITGIGDHLQPEWLITFTGMRSQGLARTPGRSLVPDIASRSADAAVPSCFACEGGGPA